MPEREPRNKPTNAPKPLDLNSDLPPDADAEERFNDFWKKNGPGIFGGIALAAVVVCGMQLYQYLQRRAETKMADAYRASTTVESKIEFADTYGDEELAGVALLQAADARYEAGEYAAAADTYRSAATALEGSPLGARARLGLAMSLYRSGSAEPARAELEAIALNAGALDSVRGEAAYNLAVIQWEAGETDAVKGSLDIIFALKNPGLWGMRANQLQDRLGEG